MANMPTDSTDVVEQARGLLVPLKTKLPSDASRIEHALFADAIERQSGSPFWGESKAMAQFYARAPELIKALADEVERLRNRFSVLCGNCGERYLGPRDEHLHGYNVCNMERCED